MERIKQDSTNPLLFKNIYNCPQNASGTEVLELQ